MAVSDVSIANRALQKLGARRIESFNDNSPSARSVRSAFPFVRDRLLRAYRWNFAVKRARVAADEAETEYGDLARFRVPEDFLRLLRDSETGSGRRESYKDWQIEGQHIVAPVKPPLEFRYIARVTNATEFDSMFAELLSVTLAVELADEVAVDRTRKELLLEERRLAEVEARRINSLENASHEPPEDDWVLARL